MSTYLLVFIIGLFNKLTLYSKSGI